jgi:steroid delta-isomerase-like uncharacterized protein
MSDRNKSLAKRFRQTCDEGRIDAAVQEFVSTSAKMHVAGMPPLGAREVQGMLHQFYAAFPDLHHEFHDQVSEGDKVVTRMTMKGTHRAPFNGIPASGKPIAVGATVIDRFEDGRIAEHWSSLDMMSLMQQIGVIPTPG